MTLERLVTQLLHLKYTKPQVHPERMLQCCVPSTPLLPTKVAGACRGSPSSLQVFDTLLFQSSFDAVSLPFPINVAFSSRKLHKYIRRGSNVLIQGCRDVFYRLQKSEFERSRGLQLRLQSPDYKNQNYFESRLLKARDYKLQRFGFFSAACGHSH